MVVTMSNGEGEPSMSSSVEMAGIGNGTGVKTGAGGASCSIDVMDSLEIWMDVSRGHREVPSSGNSTNTAADTMETISTHRNSTKT